MNTKIKTFTKNSTVAVLITSFVVVALGFTGPATALAATAPDLGAAAGYSVFGKAGVTNVGAGTHVWGNVGADSSVTGLIASQVDGTINTPAAGVEAAILSAYGQLAAQGADAALDLAGTNTVAPGVYTVGATTLNGTLTLNGAGVYIFRSSSSIPVSSGAQVLLSNGATACNVFWQIPASMTIGTNATMVGTILADTELISLAAGATLQGRALSRIAQVTLDDNQITEPTCAAAPSGGGPNTGTINVVKHVVNDSGGTKVVSDFALFVNGTPVISGETNTFPAPGPIFTVTETGNAGYTTVFSGDCDVNGQLNLIGGDNKFCIVTNNDIGPALPDTGLVPPIISVVKVPSPLALPAGPGPVTYTYTLSNIGTVPVTDVTMVGDTCSPIVRVSGDTNGDNKLDVTETWTYTCSTTLSATHTNVITATGWANGISAVDIASATVIVGAPIVPPLIHVTKVPNPLALFSGGGMVTYTNKVTNPGTVALSNIRMTDDKCANVTYVSGDTNFNSMLDTNETWTYTCSSNLTQTTVNTVVALGDANGLTARDFAVVTVVVAVVPGLPSTGIAPDDTGILWNISIPVSFFAALAAIYFIRRRQTA